MRRTLHVPNYFRASILNCGGSVSLNRNHKFIRFPGGKIGLNACKAKDEDLTFVSWTSIDREVEIMDSLPEQYETVSMLGLPV